MVLRSHFSYPVSFKLTLTRPENTRMLFIQPTYSCFSFENVAPPSVYKPNTTCILLIRSNEGLALKTSAFQSLYGGQSTP